MSAEWLISFDKIIAQTCALLTRFLDRVNVTYNILYLRRISRFRSRQSIKIKRL